MPLLQDVFKHIDGKQAEYIKDLGDYVSVESTSMYSEYWPKITELIHRYEKRLSGVGAHTEIVNVKQFMGEGDSQCPPMLFGWLGADPKKKTILYYFHMDVHMVKEEKWHTDPFTMVEKDGQLIGRGVANTKGPSLSFMHILEAYKELKQSPPVNVKFIVEGLYEKGSPGLEAFCLARKAFVTNVDCCCITNSNWLGTKRPCVIYGQRGLCYFEVIVKGMNRDLHSGDFGGVICEPMSDLITIMNALQDHNYKITIPGVMDEVEAPSLEEMKTYQKVEFDVDELREFVGTTRLMHGEKKDRILMHMWRLPSLTLHGIEGAEVNEWEKTIIPSRVVGKFSIRIVEKQTPEHVAKCVADYIGHMWKEMNSLNNLEVKMSTFTRPWTADPNAKIYKVALKALKQVYNMDGDLIREGCTNGVSVPLRAVTGKPVVLLCLSSGDSKVQCPNEKLDIKQYMDGHKLFAAFMHEVADSL